MINGNPNGTMIIKNFTIVKYNNVNMSEWVLNLIKVCTVVMD